MAIYDHHVALIKHNGIAARGRSVAAFHVNVGSCETPPLDRFLTPSDVTKLLGIDSARNSVESNVCDAAFWGIVSIETENRKKTLSPPPPTMVMHNN